MGDEAVENSDELIDQETLPSAACERTFFKAMLQNKNVGFYATAGDPRDRRRPLALTAQYTYSHADAKSGDVSYFFVHRRQRVAKSDTGAKPLEFGRFGIWGSLGSMRGVWRAADTRAPWPVRFQHHSPECGFGRYFW